MALWNYGESEGLRTRAEGDALTAKERNTRPGSKGSISEGV